MRANRLSAACVIVLSVVLATPAAAQKRGGTLKLYHNDNPPSASLLEIHHRLGDSVLGCVQRPREVRSCQVHESLDTVIQDLAESWSWDPPYETHLQASARRDMA